MGLRGSRVGTRKGRVTPRNGGKITETGAPGRQRENSLKKGRHEEDA